MRRARSCLALASQPVRFDIFTPQFEVIRMVVMLYVRFLLSLRHDEDLLVERGVDVLQNFQQLP